MKTTVTFSDFCDAFRKMGRKNFSYEGLESLFSYLTQLEQDTGEQIELDVIALCCEYSEYASLDELRTDYTDCPADEIEALEWLRDRTTIIEFGDSCIIRQF